MQSTDHKLAKKYVHVAVALIVNKNNEVLIALRPEHVHQGGLWEFPGGKVEANESVYDALLRESKEELNVYIEHAEPYLQIRHDYTDKSVLLDVWKVKQFSGEPHGVEG
ncbi:MAG: NUDIX domain-containing protein, partial [Gammaproteobacteria bacterium]|nr:NUDIX domain-containing protein [Gammaproteobacteria bacterium]